MFTRKPRKAWRNICAVSTAPSCMTPLACHTVMITFAVFASRIRFAADALAAITRIRTDFSYGWRAYAGLSFFVVYAVSKALCFWRAKALNLQTKQQQTNDRCSKHLRQIFRQKSEKYAKFTNLYRMTCLEKLGWGTNMICSRLSNIV